MANPGDKVKIKTRREEVEGVLMPSTDENILMVKLDNGYNLGFDKKDVLSVKLVEGKKEAKEKKKEKIISNKNLPTISILHCGGTIASKVDYETGAVKAKFSPEELLEMFPELNKVANIDSRLVANMFSEDMRFEHYNLMAEEVEKAIQKGTDGIILTQGTDYIHYTAAALSFLLENLSVPVLIVGSQRSSDRGSSDAVFNLLCAVQFIANSDFGEVAVCMHDSSEDKRCVIIPGTKARKLHTSRRDAFKAVNTLPWAYVDPNGKIEYIKKSYHKKNKTEKLTLKLFNEKLKIGILKSHPHMYVEELKVYEKFDGLVLEGGGIAGNFPINHIDDYTESHAEFYEELKRLVKRIPVVGTSQCIFGRINMNVYSTGIKLQEAGVLGNLTDLTAETAFIKLAWLLSQKADVKELWSKNLRGELNEQSAYQKEFL
ncbi:MAG: Glu-tRNA(Gln) amidotransferase subunit GatD [Candidatus Woesearchaeota archaeon]